MAPMDERTRVAVALLAADMDDTHEAALARWDVLPQVSKDIFGRKADVVLLLSGRGTVERPWEAPDTDEIHTDPLHELHMAARMVRVWAPEVFPANDKGQVHFIRSIMEAMADAVERLPIPPPVASAPAAEIPAGWTLWADKAPTAEWVEWRYLDSNDVHRGRTALFDNTDGVLWRPLSDASHPAADPVREALVEALQWYGEQARLARLIHSEGDIGRSNLADDGGGKARAALSLAGAKP